MSEGLKVESKHKLNKKFLLFAIIGIAVATIVAIVLIVPNSAKAKEVKEQLSLGDKYLSELNYEQAEVSYLAVLEIDPKCAEAYIGLVNVYIATGQYEQAEEILKKAEEQLGEIKVIKEKREELERKQEEKLKSMATNTHTIGENYRIEGDTIIFFGTERLHSGMVPDNLGGATKVIIENGIIEIDMGTFYECSNLMNVEIPSSVSSIGEDAFIRCSSLKSVKIPSGIRKISEFIFQGCSSLMDVEIPSSVSSIGKYAFSDCSSLTNVEIPGSVSSIGEFAFNDCSSLTDVKIPSSINSISKGVFSGCSSLTNVEIPSSVKSIGKGAFMDCSSLMRIEIPSSVSNIGEYAFSGCTYITIITSVGSYAEQYAKENNIPYKNN